MIDVKDLFNNDYIDNRKTTLKDFIIDKKSDLQNLPINVPMGSTAFCIEDGSVYMINSSGEWVEI